MKMYGKWGVMGGLKYKGDLRRFAISMKGFGIHRSHSRMVPIKSLTQRV